MPTPYFSICIPQHNRTSFLIEACRSVAAQTFRDLEVCISDDCSTDGRGRDVEAFLEETGLPFVFRRREVNGGYDRNLRAAMDLASGRYLLLLGNDDSLKEPATLQRMRDLLTAHPAAGVMLTNFEDFATGAVTRRVQRTGPAGAGPRAAVAVFRRFSFVSGVVLRRADAERARTDTWDGTEMYQMYVGCRIIAAGAGVLEGDFSAIRKDIRVPGETVDRFSARPRVPVRGVPVQPIPVSRVAALVVAAIEVPADREHRRALVRLIVQYYAFLYPYWLFVYRRVQSWRFAAGVARAFAPSRSLDPGSVPRSVRALAWTSFALATVAGLAAPVGAASWLFAPARRLARRAAGRSPSAAPADGS